MFLDLLSLPVMGFSTLSMVFLLPVALLAHLCHSCFCVVHLSVHFSCLVNQSSGLLFQTEQLVVEGSKGKGSFSQYLGT